jgi:transposase InsO family protein
MGAGVTTFFIQPGSPWENGYVESFNGKLRDECLNGVITTLAGTHLATAQLYAGGTVPYGDRLAGWGVHPHDQFYAADTNGDGAVDLYAVNTTDFATEYLGILESEGTSDALDVRGWQADRIGEWDLRAIDHFLVGNFNGGLGWDDLFVSNSEWFGLLRSRRSSVQMDAIYYHWIHTVEYHANDWW